MNCEYCVEGHERKWHNSTDNRMRLKMTKKKRSGGKYKQLRMVVHWNSWKMLKEMDTRKSSAFKINFCPMCGRSIGGVKMRFFEVNDPYFALIQAESKEKAMEVYVKCVTDDGDGSLKDEMEEVSRDYALVNFTKTKLFHDYSSDYEEFWTPSESFVKEFDDHKNEVLLIDGALG